MQVEISVTHGGHDYLIEQVGPALWVTRDGGYSVKCFHSQSQAEVHGVAQFLADNPEQLSTLWRDLYKIWDPAVSR